MLSTNVVGPFFTQFPHPAACHRRSKQAIAAVAASPDAPHFMRHLSHTGPWRGQAAAQRPNAALTLKRKLGDGCMEPLISCSSMTVADSERRLKASSFQL